MEELAELLDVQLQHGLAPLRVTGSSMHPVLRNRKDTVMLRAFTGEIKKGDVVLYRRADGSYILHRVVSRPDQHGFLCAGDNQYVTEHVCLEQVIAVVESFYRGKKQISAGSFVYRAFMWIWLCLLPVRRPILGLRRKLGRLRRKRKL